MKNTLKLNTNKLSKEGNSDNNQRLMNIEMLRVLSMVMVITLHFLGHGKVLENLPFLSNNYVAMWVIESLSFVAINSFVMISGYFLIKSKFSIKKIIVLYIQMFFYSVTISLILAVSGLVTFELFDLITIFLPFSSSQYWFVTTYILLYLASPLLNLVINNISKKKFEYILITSFFLFSVVPNVLFFMEVFHVQRGFSLIWFIFLYAVSSYIRLYYVPNFNKVKWFTLYILTTFTLFLSRILITILTIKFLGYPTGRGLFYSYNSILVVSASVFLFIAFLNFRVKSQVINKVLLFLAPLNFSVYLIHEQPYLRNILWDNWINPSRYSQSYFLVIILSFFVALIYITCIFVELGRIKLFRFFNIDKHISNFEINVISIIEKTRLQLFDQGSDI